MAQVERFKQELENGKIDNQELSDALKNNLIKSEDRFGDDGFSLTHWASFYNAAGALQQLLLHNSNTASIAEKHGWAPAHLCAIHGNKSCLQILLNYGVDVHARDSRGYTIGHLASAHGNTYSLKSILETNYKIDSTDFRQWTAVHHAAFHGRYGALQLLAKWGANLMVVDEDGNTAAHLAAAEGHTDCLRLLVYYDHTPLIVINSHNDKGATPKGMAIQFQKQECADFLASAAREAELDEREGDNERQGGLKAAYEGNIQLLSMLIQEGLCSVNERDERGSTLAHKASGNGHTKCLRWLLDHGADVTLRNSLGETPLDVARKYGKTESVAILGGGTGLETEEDLEQSSPETLEKAHEEMEKLSEALFIAKRHFQTLGGEIEDDVEEKIKASTEKHNRIIADLKSQLSVEKEKRETLERELDNIRRQLYQAKESITQYESLSTDQQITSDLTSTINPNLLQKVPRKNKSNKAKEEGGAYFRINRK